MNPGHWWQTLTAVQPGPPWWATLLLAVASAALVTNRRAWPLARNIVTIAHEGGHALIALSTGRRLAGIRLHSDTSGVTASAGRPDGFGMVLTAAAGYPAASLLGLAAAWTLTTGRPALLLWTTLVLLAGILIQIRNLFGALTVTLTAAAVFAACWWAPPTVQSLTAHLLAWFLLAAGPRPVLELHRLRQRGQAPESDADQLARLTGIPGTVWVGLFAVITTVCLAVGGWWLTTTG